MSPQKLSVNLKLIIVWMQMYRERDKYVAIMIIMFAAQINAYLVLLY